MVLGADQQGMKRAYANRHLWLSTILILTLALTTVDTVSAEALLWAVESNPGCGVNMANAVAADGTGLYVVGFETHPYGVPGEPNARQWRVEKRSLIDGSLLWASALPDRNTLPSAASAVAVDGSGVYVVGFDRFQGLLDFEWRIEKRSLVDGSPMWTVASNPSSGLDEAHGVAIDGSALYVVGEDYTLGSLGWRIEKRSLSDGSLMWNVTSHPQEENIAWGVAVDDSGVYVVGESETPEGAGTEWRTEKRRLADGSLIWNATTHPLGERGDDSAQSVAVDPTGVYVVGGQLSPTGGFVWRVEKRRLADGSVMWNATSRPTPNNWAWGAAVDASGVYMVGYDQSPENNDEWRVEKRNLADGSLAWDVTSNPSLKTSQAKGVAVDGSGVYVVGYDMSPDNFQWRIEKRSLTDGSPVWTATSNPGTGADEATAIAIDGSALYVVGYDDYWLGEDEHSRWRIESRSLTDGSVVWSVRSNPSHLVDRPGGVAVDSTGIYVVGYQELGQSHPPRWRIEKRTLSDGSLTWTQVLTDPAVQASEAVGVAVDGSGVYVVGTQAKDENSAEWRVEKRSIIDGSLLWNATSNPSPREDAPFGVAVDDSGIYVVGSDESQGLDNDEWRIEKRHLADGSLLWNATSKPRSGAAEARAVAADASGIYVAGYDSSASSDIHEWRIEKRELGSPTPPPGPSAAGALLILAVVPAGIVAVAAAVILARRSGHTSGSQRGTDWRPVTLCPRCHRPLSHSAPYQRRYCYSCRAYV